MSHRVIDGDDPMDCDYEVEETETRSRKKAPPRRLPEPSPPGSEEDDNIEDEDEGSADEGLEYNPRLVVSAIDISSRLLDGRSGMRTNANPTTVLVISSIGASNLPPLARVSTLGLSMMFSRAGSSRLQCA